MSDDFDDIPLSSTESAGFIRRPVLFAAIGSASPAHGRPKHRRARSLTIWTIFTATAIAATAVGAASQAAAQPTTPTPTPSPSEPTAICNDGTPSNSPHRSGTCSHHGGVAQWCPCGTAPHAVGRYYEHKAVITARLV
jgi:hypothetical protein